MEVVLAEYKSPSWIVESDSLRKSAKRELVQSWAESTEPGRVAITCPLVSETTDGGSDLERSKRRARSFSARPAMADSRLWRGEAKFSFVKVDKFNRRELESSPAMRNLPSGENHVGRRNKPRFANCLMLFDRKKPNGAEKSVVESKGVGTPPNPVGALRMDAEKSFLPSSSL